MCWSNRLRLSKLNDEMKENDFGMQGEFHHTAYCLTIIILMIRTGSMGYMVCCMGFMNDGYMCGYLVGRIGSMRGYLSGSISYKGFVSDSYMRVFACAEKRQLVQSGIMMSNRLCIITVTLSFLHFTFYLSFIHIVQL